MVRTGDHNRSSLKISRAPSHELRSEVPTVYEHEITPLTPSALLPSGGRRLDHLEHDVHDPSPTLLDPGDQLVFRQAHIVRIDDLRRVVIFLVRVESAS